MQAMTAEQKQQFARDCSDLRAALAAKMDYAGEVRVLTKLYLFQLACMTRSPNPSLLTAIPIVQASQKWSRRIGMPPLTLEDLLVGTHVVGDE